MPAKPVHNTAVTEGEWDGPAAVANMPNEEATLWYCHAWRDPDGDPDAKKTYKFPHHRTNGGPAVLNGVRNALARLPNSSIPEDDKPGVERHLRAHLDAQEDSLRVTDDWRELRSFPVGELRVVGEEAEAPRIEGYAAVYNQRSELLWSFYEVIEPGFFEAALHDDIRSVWNHNDDKPLGRTANQTLRLNDDQHGLGVTILPPDTSWGQDAIKSIDRGDVTQMSFSFTVKEKGDHWVDNEDGTWTRYLKRGGCKRLYEVSPVTFPAYPQTSVSVRSKIETLKESAGSGPAQRGQDPEAQAEAQARRTRHKLRKNLFQILDFFRSKDDEEKRT